MQKFWQFRRSFGLLLRNINCNYLLNSIEAATTKQGKYYTLCAYNDEIYNKLIFNGKKSFPIKMTRLILRLCVLRKLRCK